jgi:dual specificity tyrosine-phosphorylation-regulated kinase 2/3/4
LQYLR